MHTCRNASINIINRLACKVESDERVHRHIEEASRQAIVLHLHKVIQSRLTLREALRFMSHHIMKQ